MSPTRVLLLFLALAALVADNAPAEAPLAGSRPNILLVMTDDQGYGQVGRHGHPWLRTPNLDRLYDASLRFDRFLVSPTCSPTRAAMMTGRHPMRNGITHTILERERMTLDAVTLPQVLSDAGYQTAIFGKWHLGDEDAYQPQNRGFDHACIHGAGGIGQAYACSCADAPDNSYFDPVVRLNGRFVKTNGFCTDVFFDAALDWIRKAKERPEPFFAYVPTNAPHGPFLAPDEDRRRFTEMGFSDVPAGFFGMIENIDTNVGRLLSKLDEWGLAQSTLVIFMSDNGTAGGNTLANANERLGNDASGAPLHGYNAGMRGAKGSPHEGGVRVPFFVRWSGRIQAGRDLDQVAAHIDLFPTLARLAAAEIPEAQVEGRSLLPLIEDAQAEWPERYLFTHCGRWEVGAEPDDHQWDRFAVRSHRFRMVGKDSLFDMDADPGQEANVIDQHPEVAAKMREAYDEWWRATRPLMVNESTPLSTTRPFHVAYEQQLRTEGIPDWAPPTP